MCNPVLRKKVVCLLLVLLPVIKIFAVENDSVAEIDCLTSLLEISPDELKSRIYLRMSELVMESDKQLAADYAQHALRLAAGHEMPLDQIRSLCILSHIAILKDEKPQALKYIRPAFDILKSANKKHYSEQQIDELEGQCLFYKTKSYDGLYPDSAMVMIMDLLRAVDLLKSSRDQMLCADAFYLLGRLYADAGIFDKSSENLDHAIKIYQSSGEKKKLADAFKLASFFVERTQKIHYIQQAIDMYSQTGDSLLMANAILSLTNATKSFMPPKATLEYFDRVLEIYGRLENYPKMALTYFLLGTFYLNEFQDTATGKCIYFKGVEICRQKQVLKNAGHLYVAIGTMYTVRQELDSAGYWFHLADSVTQFMPGSSERTRYLYQAGQYYRYLKKYDVAKQMMLDALELTKTEKDYLLERNIYHYLYYLYRDLGDYRRALQSYKRYKEMQDSVFRADTEKDVVEMQIRYETQQKENKLVLMKKNDELKDAEIRRKEIYLAAFSSGLLLTALFSLLLARQYIKKRRAYAHLMEKNIELISQVKSPGKRKVNENNTAPSIDPELKGKIMKKLNYQVKHQKIFLRSDLTLNMLAKKCQTNSSYLSRLINEVYHTNFSGFINQLRIREAQRLMGDAKYTSYSIEGIASTVGFKTKSVFNTAFKKYTGVTPSYYLEYLQNK